MQSLTIRILFVFLILFVFFVSIVPITKAATQTTYKLSGVVADEFNHPLAGATVQFMDTQKGTSTDRHGAFSFYDLEKNTYVIKCSFLGYSTVVDTLDLNSDKEINIKLHPENKQLDELMVTANQQNSHRADNTLSLEVADKAFLQKNTAGSLMQNLACRA